MPTARLLIILMIAQLFSLNASAQTWQWGVRGGSSGDPWSGTNSSNQEQVYDMATDKQGNVYTLSVVTGSAASLGNTYVTTYGRPVYGTPNILITSHSCDGRLRWVTAIGGQSNGYATAIRTDTLGHVYVLADAPGLDQDSIHIGADTVVASRFRRLFIIQYDTSGRLNWIRMPDPDTLTSFSRAQAYDIEMDGAGNLNALVWLNKGSLNRSPFATAGHGLYVLKYNPQGTLLAATRPPGFNFTTLTGTGSRDGYPMAAFESIRMTRMPNSNWVVAGTQALIPGIRGFTINGKTVNNELFIACFNSAWQHQWQYTSVGTLSGIFGRPVVDNSNAIYLTGYSHNRTNLFGVNVPPPPMGSLPYVAKLNSNGVGQWVTLPSSIHTADRACSAALRGLGIARTTGGDLMITSGCGGLKWGTASIPGKCNTGYSAFVGRFNTTTGTCLGLDTIAKLGTGAGNRGTAIVAGRNGSVYVGGSTAGAQIAGRDTIMYWGGTSDFFIARHGFACNCTGQPVSAFTSTAGAGRTFRFGHTGTASAIDSVVWLPGDGQRLTMRSAYAIPVRHTYATPGSYDVCAVVYSSCGTASSCRTVTVANAASAGGPGVPADLKVYPNPVGRFLTIEAAEAGTAVFANAVGQPVLQQQTGSGSVQLDLGAVQPGIYMLQLRDAAGNLRVIRISKL